MRGLTKTYDTEFKPMLDQVLARVEETGQELEVINAEAHNQTHRMLDANAQQSHNDHAKTHTQLEDIHAITTAVDSHVLESEKTSARVEGSVEKGKQKSEEDHKQTHGRLEVIREDIAALDSQGARAQAIVERGINQTEFHSQQSKDNHQKTHAELERLGHGVIASEGVMTRGFGEVKGLITNAESARERAEEERRARERTREDRREFEEVLDKCRVWLQPVSNDHERTRSAKAHQSGTCEWLLGDEGYLKWLEVPSDGEAQILVKALIVLGIPGMYTNQVEFSYNSGVYSGMLILGLQVQGSRCFRHI